LRFERVDNLGAYRIPPETGILIPSVCDSYPCKTGSNNLRLKSGGKPGTLIAILASPTVLHFRPKAYTLLPPPIYIIPFATAGEDHPLLIAWLHSLAPVLAFSAYTSPSSEPT
jgi:hypothetical protein